MNLADWDGNGTETIGVYKSANKRFYLRNTNAAGSSDIRSGPYGITGDIPIVGDWDGDGKDTMGVYRPSSRRFYLRNDWDGGVAQIGVTFGLAGDIPVVGDWDGDGVDSIGVFRPSTRRFYLSNSLSNTVDVTSRVYGRSTDLPVIGNWDNSVGHDGTRVSVDVTITGMPVGTLIDGAFTAVAGDHLGSSSVVRDHHSKTRLQRYTPYGAIRDDSHRRNSLQVDETFKSVRRSRAFRHKATGEIWELDMLHRDHYEVYENKKQWEKGRRIRDVWSDGRPKGCF